jgi:hypothetical protein
MGTPNRTGRPHRPLTALLLLLYSSHRPTDDPIAVTHFLAVAQGEMERALVQVPLLASHRELVAQTGPLGRAWLPPGGFQPGYAFQPR